MSQQDNQEEAEKLKNALMDNILEYVEAYHDDKESGVGMLSNIEAIIGSLSICYVEYLANIGLKESANKPSTPLREPMKKVVDIREYIKNGRIK